MAGAGVLPGRVAAEAARQGWRVVAFALSAAPDLPAVAHRVIPCRLTDIRAVLEALRAERVSAVVFSGRLPKGVLFKADVADAPARQILSPAGGLSDSALGAAVVETLAGLGIEVLDQRTFLASLLAPAGILTSRSPSEAEWRDIGLGLRLARQCAEYGVGQTVVVARGVAVAVEAIEGTSDTIERGCRLAGPGAVVVKALAVHQDYRFDVPAVGLETLEVMARGQAQALAVEAGKVAILDLDAVVVLANRAGIAIASVDRDG
jgi:DUF1009 family protein